jgi:hypothetical protein
MRKWMVVFIVLGMLASLVQVFYRYQSESVNKEVEIAFDYRDLVEISSMKADGTAYLDRQLKLLQEQGVTTICISESSIEELEQLRRINVLTAQQLALVNKDMEYDPGFTYLTFNQDSTISYYKESIKMSFNRENIRVDDWDFFGRPGLKIALPSSTAKSYTLLPDEVSLKTIQEMDFKLLFKMSNRITYDTAYTETMFKILDKYNVDRLLFDGEAIPGFIPNNDELSETNMIDLARLLNKYNIGISVVEMLQTDVKGLPQLAQLINNNVVRIHSITENDVTIEPEVLRDRIVLAVEDRNIRIVFLNAVLKYVAERNRIIDTIADRNLEEALVGEDGVVQSLKNAGFTFAKAEPFQLKTVPFEKVFTALIALGCMALGLALVSHFAPTYVNKSLIIGLILVPILLILSETTLYKILALLAAVSSPTLAMIYMLKFLRQGTSSIIRVILIFVATCAGSMIGSLFVIGLLSGVTYMIVLNQFAGVNVLHLMPILLMAIYILFYFGKQTAVERVDAARDFLQKPVSIMWAGAAAVVGAMALYYLSRTGNTGQAIDLEMVVRRFLEENIGVRPRIKEFLFAHPLFIFAAYLYYRYKQAVFLFVFATMGQLSIVSTFTHLHTPLTVSSLRVLYGMIGGILVALLAIMIWKLLEKGWNKWLLSLKKS